MFQSVEKEKGLLPKFNWGEFDFFSKAMRVGSKEFHVESLLAIPSIHPLCGGVGNMGSWEPSPNGFPVLKIQEDEKSFGFAFYKCKWVYWNNNLPWHEFVKIVEDKAFQLSLEEKTGFDLTVFQKINEEFPSGLNAMDEGEGKGKTWMIDSIFFHERSYPIRWIWVPNPKGAGTLQVLFSSYVVAEKIVDEQISPAIIRAKENRLLDSDLFMLKNEGIEPRDVCVISNENRNSATERLIWERKFGFNVQARNLFNQLKMTVKSRFEEDFDSFAKQGFVTIKIEFEKNFPSELGDRLMGYVSFLLQQFLEMQVQKPVVKEVTKEEVFHG